MTARGRDGEEGGPRGGAERRADAAGAGEAGSGTEPRLEDELRRLETIVQRLEREDVPLDEALALFEEGIAIARSARSRLESAEGRIREILREAGDSFRVRELDP
jgi:exodeoxyribonuclease VII small subunit